MMKIGWATREFTPARPAMLQGQMHRRVARTALDHLMVTAWALEGQSPEDNTIFISCDLVSVPTLLCQMVSEGILRRTQGILADHIILNATHTHTSLVLDDWSYEPADKDVMTPTECLELVANSAVEAGVEAWEKRKPGVVGRAFGHAVVGHNRHAVYTDRHAAMYGQTNREDFAWIGGYEDHSVDMLFTWDLKGQLSGIALAIPCPSQVDEQLEQYSADYWHEVRIELRQRLGSHLQVLPICSTAGDQSPHFLINGKLEEEMRKRRGVTERQEIARQVADAVELALKGTQPETSEHSPLAHRVQKMALTPWKVSKVERDWAQSAYDEWTAKGDANSWWPKRLHWVVDCFDGKEIAQPVETEIHAVRIGNAVIVTNPFELSLDYGMQMKARSTAVQTITMQLAAGDATYLPSERAAQGGGYGAMPAVAAAGAEGGKELVTATLTLINSLTNLPG